MDDFFFFLGFPMFMIVLISALDDLRKYCE